MPGLFVSCGIPPVDGESGTAERLMTSACRISVEKAETIRRDDFEMVVTHRGEFRSTGASVGTDSSIVCLGSYWFSSDDQTLATPTELRLRLRDSGRAKGGVIAGVFCYAFWNDLEKQLVLESEKTGAYPLYYLEYHGGLLVSTDLKSFFESGFHSGELDLEGVAEYLRIGHIASHRTFFRGIKKVPFGYRLFWRQGRCVMCQVWRYQPSRDQALEDRMLDEMGDILHRSFRRYAAEPIGYSLTLSGGLDSRMLAASATEAGLAFSAISVGPRKSLECQIARKIAAILGVPAVCHEHDGEGIADWLPSMIWLNEGRCPPAHIHYFETMFSGVYPRGAQIHGLIGDAVLGGGISSLSDELGKLAEPELRSACRTIVTNAFNYWPHRWESLFCSELVQRMNEVQESVVSDLLQWYPDVCEDGGLEAFRYWFRSSALIGVGLSSQVTPWVEIVCPFADPKLFGLAGRIRRQDLLERKVQYKMVHRRWPAMATVPRIKAGISISMSEWSPLEYEKKARSQEIRKRVEYYARRLSYGRVERLDHTGFHDYGRWYRRDRRLRDLFADTMHTSRAASRGLWSTTRMNVLMDGLRNGKNLWPALASVVFLELYLQQLLSGTGRPVSNIELESIRRL